MNVSSWQELLGVCEMLTAGLEMQACGLDSLNRLRRFEKVETLAGRFSWAGT